MDKSKSKLPLVCPENVRKMENNKNLSVDNQERQSQVNRKLGKPHKLRMPAQIPLEGFKSVYQDSIGHRVISAKMLRVKELQNQLSDAQYRLNELANENRILRILQKRQDSALRKYEGANADLPRIINSHYEELKALQVKYKQLKKQHKQTCEILKERENEIQILQDQNKHLQKLNKDQNLIEREKLQIQVADLNYQVQQQHETIQILNRKLSLESKKLKHQIHFEMGKYRETKKQLDESLEKIKKLEELLDVRERRLYENAKFKLKAPKTSSQSLISLKNSNSLKFPRQIDDENDSKGNILPKLTPDGPETPKIDSRIPKSETMTSFQQIRKFRLQKSARNLGTLEAQQKRVDSNKSKSAQVNSEKFEDHQLDVFLKLKDSEIDNFGDLDQQLSHLNMESLVDEQYRVLFASSDSENECKSDNDASPTRKSKDLYIKLTSEDSPSLKSPKDEEQVEDELNLNKSPTTATKNELIEKIKESDEINQKKSWLNLKKARKSEENLNLMDDLKSSIVNEQDLQNYFEKQKSDLINEISQVNDVLKELKSCEVNKQSESSNNNKTMNGNVEYDGEKTILGENKMNSPTVDNIINRSDNNNSGSSNSSSHSSSSSSSGSSSNSGKSFNFIKDEMLTAIKTIDDNEYELISETKNRQQINENLYRSLQIQTKKRDDIIRDIFSDTKVDRLRPGCSKLY